MNNRLYGTFQHSTAIILYKVCVLFHQRIYMKYDFLNVLDITGHIKWNCYVEVLFNQCEVLNIGSKNCSWSVSPDSSRLQQNYHFLYYFRGVSVAIEQLFHLIHAYWNSEISVFQLYEWRRQILIIQLYIKSAIFKPILSLEKLHQEDIIDFSRIPF